MEIKLRSFISKEHINEKGDGSYRGFGYLSLFSGPIDLATWSQRELLKFCNFQKGSRYEDSVNQMRSKILKVVQKMNIIREVYFCNYS